MDPVLIQYHAVGSEEWVWHPGRRVFVQQLVAVVLACTFHGIEESLLAGQCWLCSTCRTPARLLEMAIAGDAIKCCQRME